MPRRERVSATIEWHGVVCEVSHQPDHINQGWSLIQVKVFSPLGAPIPITDSGYRSRQLDEDELNRAGGYLEYVRAWLERESTTDAYKRSLERWNQLKLFR